MTIRIKSSQRKTRINKRSIIHLAEQVLKIKGIKQAQLSIYFTGKRRIRKLNKQFRNINQPTDVLAFAMRAGRGKGKRIYSFLAGPQILGDVVICPQVAGRFAKIYRSSLEQEIALDLIHGILHLLGYQDTSVRDRRIMEREQLKILKRYGKAKYHPKLQLGH